VRELRRPPCRASSAGSPHELARWWRRAGDPLSLVTFFGGAKKVTSPSGLNPNQSRVRNSAGSGRIARRCILGLVLGLRNRNAVLLRRPRAEVDQPAALGAERPVGARRRPFDGLAAAGARYGAYFSHENTRIASWNKDQQQELATETHGRARKFKAKENKSIQMLRSFHIPDGILSQ